MDNQVISMQQIRALIQLLEKGYSLRSISTELSMSRQPVTLYAARIRSSPYTLQDLRHLSDADLAAVVYTPPAPPDYSDDTRRLDLTARIPYYLAELKRTGVTRLLLWEEYCRECNNPYRYTQFCILLKEAGRTTQATMHLVHAPAAMVMVDFAGDKMSYIDRSTGEVIQCPVLVSRITLQQVYVCDGTA
jgi:hypothetical protein